MSGWCPACRREWPDEREACGTCLAALVTDLDATVVCGHCGTVAPARMQSCPSCLGELRVDPERAAESIAASLAAGHRMARPASVAPFVAGANCSLLRRAARSSLVYCGPDELLEASVEGMDHRAVPPLRCVDFDDSLLFRLNRYQATTGAVVAVARDGAPLGTYIRGALSRADKPDAEGLGLHVRDETSAPVATLRPSRRADADYELVETGGRRLGTCAKVDADLDGWIDDQWTLRVVPELPLKPLAGVALLLAAKVLLGRPSPTPAHQGPYSFEEEDAVEGRWSGWSSDWS